MENIIKIDHSIMRYIDSYEKAYVLGSIAGVGIIIDGQIIIEFNEKDNEILEVIRDFFCPQIHISKHGCLSSFSIMSEKIANDVINHLKCPLEFPHAIEDKLKWDFIRGFFDCTGNISHLRAGYPRCSINSSYPKMLENIRDFCGVKAIIKSEMLEWSGVNAIDFLAKLYANALIYNTRKYIIFISLSNQMTCSIIDRLPIFKWSKTIPEGIKPEKNRFSDSGFDLHLVKKIKVQGGVHFFDTGIQIQPENGYYFDMVGRSSISKTGWMLANNIGIIDASYTGSVIAALIKIDPDAAELELPCKLVQIIPRHLILMQAIEVDSLDDTERGTKGFGSSNR